MQQILPNKRVIRFKINKGLIIQTVGLLFSCINETTLTVWLIINIIVLLIKFNNQFTIEFFIILQIRSLLNPGIAEPFSSLTMIIKWISIFTASFILLVKSKDQTNHKIRKANLLFILLGIYLILSAFFVSSYPVVAAFKVVGYVVPFIAILDSIYATRETNWIHEINVLFGIASLGSIVLLSHPVAYLRTGYMFQGFFNHPNLFGVITAIFFAGFLYERNGIRKGLFDYLIIGLCAFLIFRSYSRTALLSFAAIIILNIITSGKKWYEKTIYLVFLVSAFLIVLFLSKTWQNQLLLFMYKRGSSFSGILYSRMGQITDNLDRFLSSPAFGTGFNVPFEYGIKRTAFSFDQVTENGNIILAVLGDMGLVGALLFFICFRYLFSLGKHNPKGYALFFAPFIISMGEMGFFSTNNFGIILYLYFGIFVSEKMLLQEREGGLRDLSSFFDDDTFSVSGRVF